MTFAQIIIEDALLNEITNQRRLLSAAVANKNDSEIQRIWARIYELKNQINNIKEDRNMKKLEEMTSKELKAMAKREGVASWWTLSKAKLIEGIKAKRAEAEPVQAPTELTDEEIEYVKHDVEALSEVVSEAPTEPIEEPKEETKKNTKAEPKRANKKLTELTYHGETKSIREWAEEIGMPWPTLYDRVNRNGWSVEDAIETPLGKRRTK